MHYPFGLVRRPVVGDPDFLRSGKHSDVGTAGEFLVYEWPANCRIFVSRVSLAPDREDADFVGKDFVFVLVVITALCFDFTNGFHDTGNAMATSIATKALRPRVAVSLSAVLNLIGAFLSSSVAATIAGGWPLAPVTGSHG